MAGFVEQQFTCAIGGDRYEAIVATTPPSDVVCMSCGLKYGNEQRKRLIAEKKARRTR